jgi:hypothetical protein
MSDNSLKSRDRFGNTYRRCLMNGSPINDSIALSQSDGLNRPSVVGCVFF